MQKFQKLRMGNIHKCESLTCQDDQADDHDSSSRDQTRHAHYLPHSQPPSGLAYLALRPLPVGDAGDVNPRVRNKHGGR